MNFNNFIINLRIGIQHEPPGVIVTVTLDGRPSLVLHGGAGGKIKHTGKSGSHVNNSGIRFARGFGVATILMGAVLQSVLIRRNGELCFEQFIERGNVIETAFGNNPLVCKLRFRQKLTCFP